MGSIADKMNYLLETKREIREAIAAKGVSVSDGDTFRSYADKIASIEQGSGGDISIEDAIVTKTSTTYSNDRVTSIGDYVFMNNNKLVSISLPNVTKMGRSSFNACSLLNDVNVPQLQTITTQTFYNCGVERLVFPSLKAAAAQCMRQCKKLVYVDLWVCAEIAQLAFDSCALLSILVIRTPSVCSLGNTSGINNTAISAGTGYVYVPRNLIDSYKAATNWVTYASQFRALEDYTVDGTTKGEIDFNKI